MCGQIRQHIYRDKPVNVWTGVRVDGCEQVLCANVFYLVQCGNKNVQKGDDRSDFFFLLNLLKNGFTPLRVSAAVRYKTKPPSGASLAA